jgi:hypothetical protein
LPRREVVEAIVEDHCQTPNSHRHGERGHIVVGSKLEP